MKERRKKYIMKNLFLEDLSGMSEQEVIEHIINGYEADEAEIDKFHILIAYESVGSWGCDSSSFFLLKDKTTGELYENHGSHCSCYGFEGQFEPEPTTIEYLKSEHFYFSCGGYDDSEDANTQKVLDILKCCDQSTL